MFFKRITAAVLLCAFTLLSVCSCGAIDPRKERDGKPRKYFTISFDDGITQDKKIIEIFKKYDFTACTFFINTGLCGVSWPAVGAQYGRADVTHIRFTEDELRSGIYDGYDVAVHTLEHLSLKNFDENADELVHQIEGDADNIESITGRRPVGMAWPGGPTEYTETTVKNAAEHTTMKFARRMGPTYGFDLPTEFLKWDPTCSVSDNSVLDLARSFISAECTHDMLFYVWGHGYELDLYDRYGVLEELIKMMSEAEDVVLVTNTEFYELFKDEIPSLKG